MQEQNMPESGPLREKGVSADEVIAAANSVRDQGAEPRRSPLQELADRMKVNPDEKVGEELAQRLADATPGEGEERYIPNRAQRRRNQKVFRKLMR